MTAPANWTNRAQHVWSSRTLRAVLLGRVVWNASFALYLLQLREETVAQLVSAFVKFALVDGALALLMAAAYVVVCPRRMLWLSPATDAATRATLVAMAQVGPGMLGFPLTAILYLALIATFVFGDGALDFAEGVSLDRELGHGSGWLALVISGLVAMAVGATLLIADPNAMLLRALLAVLTAVHAVSYASGMRHIPLLLAADAPEVGEPAMPGGSPPVT